MRLLEDKSVEHAFAVHVDKDGSVHIQSLGMGSRASALIDLRNVLAGVEKFGTQQIYLVHNHPSGNMKPSTPDIQVTENMAKAAARLGVTVDHIIMDTLKQEYVHMNPDAGYGNYLVKQREAKSDNTPLTAHKLDGQKALSEPLGRVKSPEDVATVLYQLKFSAVPKSGMLVVDNAGNVVGNYVFRSDFGPKELIKEATSHPTATGVILYGNRPMEHGSSLQSHVEGLKRELSGVDIGVLDYVNVKGGGKDIKEAYDYVSAIEGGTLRDVENKYGTNRMTGELREPYESEKELPLINEKGKINRDALRKEADRILSGSERLDRLSPREEDGRKEGGRRNVEASLLLRGSKSPGSTEVRKERARQEKLLKKYAEATNGWTPASTIEKWKPLDEGMENRVYLEGSHVKKVGYNYLNFYDTPQQFIDGKITLNNVIFPDTPIQLAGFTETHGANGKGSFFAPIVRQPFVQGEALKPGDQHLVDAEMKKYGFGRVGKNDYVSKDYVIKDLHPENVIVDKDGNYLFIDTNPMLNTPEAGFGGSREYGKVPKEVREAGSKRTEGTGETGKESRGGAKDAKGEGTQHRTGTPPDIATTLEAAAKKPVSVHDIARFINKVFNVPVRRKLMGTGKSVLGFYKTGPEVIRVKNTNDIGTLAHELAHHIDKKNKLNGNWPPHTVNELKALDYDPKQQRAFEGFAEFVRKWMTGDGDLSKEAPKFLAWWENDFLKRKDGMGEQLKQVKQFVDIWREQGCERTKLKQFLKANHNKSQSEISQAAYDLKRVMTP